jgi:putative DNA primase/helicase
VPFTVTIPDEEKDKALPAKLKAELPGILNWALKGCLDWQAHGIGEPEDVTQATDQYRAEQDAIQQFLNECCHCDRKDPSLRTKVATLYEAFGRWSGDRWMTQPKFNQEVENRGFRKERMTHGYFWYGIGLLADGPEDHAE